MTPDQLPADCPECGHPMRVNTARRWWCSVGGTHRHDRPAPPKPEGTPIRYRKDTPT